MLANVLLSLALACSASAAPLVAPSFPTVAKRDNSPFNITYSSPRNATYDSLPRLLIMATGGTIAGSSTSNTDSTAYTAGAIGVAALVEAVPELLETAQIDGVQVANVGSNSLSDAIALNISKLATKAVCGDDAPYDAVVITHGTDTLEETAFFLDITVNCSAPIVVVGAMRPATAISADGPNNLLSAARTAVSPLSRDRGTLITLNDRICSAFFCQKTEANTLDTFESPEFGCLGHLLSVQPFYHYPPSMPTFKKVYDISKVQSLPPVEIIYGFQGSDFHLVKSAVESGAKGVVTAGTGAGSLSTAGQPLIDSVIAQGIPVVRSTKINSGFVAPSTNATTIAGGVFNPVKTRRMLQVLLALGKTNDEIRAAFEEPLGSYLTQF
ncbi:asparaginase [Sporobolomyces salmoneus]|uniref:asparaginase n=1 Tax=Sporobolomyces salmoneus TaxID=183962 RepID=UPI003174FBBB